MENKMNQDTLSEKSNPQSAELSDQELEQAAGGGGYVERRDSQGRITHWYTDYGEVYHYTCPKCGRILHRGSFAYLFCDPCDDWFTSSSAKKVIDTPGRKY